MTALTALAALMVALAAPVVSPASAAGTTRYISNLPGSNCSNAGAGTSSSQPWCDFTPANTLGTLQPGDRLLLARGATWNQQLTLTGSGTVSSPIELGAYGTGSRPHVTRNALDADRAIRINNGSHWVIRDLEISNSASGLLMWYDQPLHQGITISNLYVHGISGIHQGDYVNANNDELGAGDGIWNSAGITFTGEIPRPLTSSEYMLKTVKITDVEGTNNQSSLSFDWYNGERRTEGTIGFNNVVDVELRNLYFHDDDGAGRSEGCDEGMRIVAASNVIMTDSVLDNEAACGSNTGTAAMLIGRIKNAKFLNNVWINVPTTTAPNGQLSPDRVAIDYEMYEVDVHFIGNVFANNSNTGISYLDIWPDNVITGAVSASNTFISNGSGAHRQGGNVTVPPQGSIRDNLFYEPNRFTFTDYNGTFSGFNFSNNQRSSTAAAVSSSALHFSSTQGGSAWSYQYQNGSTWTNLGHYDETAKVWQLSSSVNVPQIGKTSVHPGVNPTAHVARTWTAPQAGLVSIRGLAAKAASGGDGVLARVTHNGATVWPSSGYATIAASNTTGVETSVDRILVAAGDVVRFEVTPNGSNEYDTVTWSPTIAYVSWEFATDGVAEGWGATNDVTTSVANGSMSITNTGNDPYIVSSDFQTIDAGRYDVIQVRMANATTATTAEIFFRRSTDTAFASDRSVVFAVNPNSAMTTYTVVMSSSPQWNGTVETLRLDPPGLVGGSSAIDWVRLIG